MARATKTQAMLDWFHGRTDKPMPTPEGDVGQAFFAGWDARERTVEQVERVRATLDVPNVVRWIESVSLQPRVSLPAHDYDELRAEVERLRAANADDIRALGWTIAVHNDYRYVGVEYTFWLFTRDGRAVKGEGRTDADALAEVRQQIVCQT